MKKFISTLAVATGLTFSVSTPADAMTVSQYCTAYAEMGKSIVLARQSGIPQSGNTTDPGELRCAIG